MKFVKKLTALFLAVCMVMAMGITAFAEGETGSSNQSSGTTYTISTKSDDTHTYKVYQIFTGTLSKDGKTLSDVKAGKNFKTKNGAKTDGTDMTATEAAEYLASITASDDSTKLKSIEKFVDVSDEGKTFGEVTKDESLTGVPAGYYLIMDQKNSLSGKNDAYTTYITKVVKNVEIERKATKPEVQKKVKDKNDSEQAADAYDSTGWQDSADYDVNDAIPFQLTATLPSDADDFASYETYKLIFHDVQSKGLTFNEESVKVYYGSSETDRKELGSGQYSLTDSSLKDGCTFEVSINNIKSVTDVNGGEISVSAGGKVYVEYTSTLNGNSVIGSTGNPNKVYLEYSNNPNSEGKGETGKTPEDKVIVFTYQVNVNKVDSNKEPLAGAKFTLYKWQATTNESAKGYKDGFAWIKVGDEIEAKAVHGENGETVVSYTSSFLRVDDGKYLLSETTTPDGYSTMEDVEFTITASHDEESDDPTLVELSGGEKFDGTVETGIVSADIENKKGAELPSTGGVGTTVIYIAGIALIVAAGVVVIARKRMA